MFQQMQAMAQKQVIKLFLFLSTSLSLSGCILLQNAFDWEVSNHCHYNYSHQRCSLFTFSQRQNYSRERDSCSFKTFQLPSYLFCLANFVFVSFQSAIILDANIFRLKPPQLNLLGC